MALNITIDLNGATFADLEALVDAARVAGVEKNSKVELEDTSLHIQVDTAGERPHGPVHPGPGGHSPRPVPQVGEAAIRSVIDILSGRLEPPRR
ncbi:hypothetical protein CAPI_03720 [Corynebacterium capitovis DSM 44611]|uniref:hypothetical protein n=1 Tax=Corynebacterium capitovis TaxID=131081 RepID=UPI00036A0232|nr:hypothetical protein [Corynebacterium capitovis]WKD57302.1 hypothetical protein CAPI_03720 [Corynebacterium capitovis DSM 44611]